jgi:WD40 repeat protein
MMDSIPIQPDDPNSNTSAASTTNTNHDRTVSHDFSLMTPTSRGMKRSEREYASFDALPNSNSSLSLADLSVTKSLGRKKTTKKGVLNLFKRDKADDAGSVTGELTTGITQSEEVLLKVKGNLKGNSTFTGLRMIQEICTVNEPVGRPITPSPSMTSLSVIAKNGRLTRSASGSLTFSSKLSSPKLKRNTGNKNSSTWLQTNPVWIMRFSKDGAYMACGKNNGEVDIYQAPKLSDTTSLFDPVPFKTFKDHSLPITDISWSYGNFLLTSSMDNTVKLYHIHHPSCLCTFYHTDSVSSVTFNPNDQDFFASGSLDGRIRIWSITQKKVVHWNETYRVPVTCIAFTKDGSTVVVGTSTGLCIFYDFDGLKYNTQIHISGHKGTKAKDCKITGIENMPKTSSIEEKLLVTSTDSRLRLINVRDKSLHRKYKGT